MRNDLLLVGYTIHEPHNDQLLVGCTMQEISSAATSGHACFANLSQSIGHVPVGSVTVSIARPQNSGPMQWTVSAREGPGAGTAKHPSKELTKFAAPVGEVSVKAVSADTN